MPIKKRCGSHTMDNYSAMRKKDILAFATTEMDLEHLTFSEVSQTEKVLYHHL